MKIGTITRKQILKATRKGNRDAELELNIGWKQQTKVHQSMKAYNRKVKYKPIY